MWSILPKLKNWYLIGDQIYLAFVVEKNLTFDIKHEMNEGQVV